MGFVQASGPSFVRDGQIFQGVGVNWFSLLGIPGIETCSGPIPGDMASAIATLRAATGCQVLRFWAFQSFTQSGTNWAQFDAAIAAAKANGILLLPTLADGYSNCEDGNSRGIDWFAGGYRQVPSGGFYTLSYRDYVALLVDRYKNEDTIFGWMLVNEPQPGASTVPFQSFCADMSSLMHSIDPNHLVTPGTSYDPVVAGMASIDFGDVHNYNGGSSGMTAPFHGKPWVMGEAGFPNTYLRPGIYGQMIQAALANGAGAFLIWSYNPQGTRGTFDVGPTDPVTTVLLDWARRLGYTTPAGALVPLGLGFALGAFLWALRRHGYRRVA